MDAPAIWRWYMAQHTAGHYLNPAKGDLHRPAIGYQWNVCLRPRTQDGMRAADGTVMNTTYVHCDSGRWNRRPEQLATHANVSCTSWTDYILYPPRALYGTSGVWGYAAQAVSPDEIQGTSRVAQAWDSMDLNTAPNVDVGQTGSGAWTMENLQPGWHVGPFNRGTRGLALLNGARHLGSPNILYADGHVGRDATRVVTGADLESCPNGSWTGINVVTWPDSAPNFGTLNHIVPVLDYLN
jgi:prepilin-type processing-associated H-X9-DG protein